MSDGGYCFSFCLGSGVTYAYEVIKYNSGNVP